jgi:hypothetical protein
MNKQFAGLEIRRDDIKALYDSIEEPWMILSDGCYDWFNDMRVCRQGIYLMDPEEGGRDPIGLSNEEREALPQHPTDDYEAPLLKLPSTLVAFESFIDRNNLPAPDGFRLLDWLAKRINSVATKGQDDDIPDPRRRNTYLRVIAALMVRGKVATNDLPYVVAEDLNVKLEVIGCKTMKPDTIASVITEARNLIAQETE